MSPGAGAYLIIGGWVAFAITSVLLAFDNCGVDKSGKGDVNNDGISVEGRLLGSLGSILTYCLIFLALTNPSWMAIDDLGQLGSFCDVEETVNNAQQNGRTMHIPCGKKANLGLWMYCVEEDVPWFPGGPVNICVKYDDVITVTSYSNRTSGYSRHRDRRDEEDGGYEGYEGYEDDVPVSDVPDNGSPDNADSKDATEAAAHDLVSADATPRDGNARFGGVNAKQFRTWTSTALFGSAFLSMAVDIYSEKLWIGLLMSVSAIAGIVGTIIWAMFQAEVKEQVSGDVKMSTGGGIIIGAWCVAILSTIGYGINSVRHCQEHGCQKRAASDDEEDDYETEA